MKRLLALPLMLLTATPASAITWEEFWEPLDRDKVEVHHYHHGHHGLRKKRCWGMRWKYYEGDFYHEGYWKKKMVRVRCHRPHRHHLY